MHTSTQLANGSTLLPPVFAGGLLGGAYNGTTVNACAQAEWGAPTSATTAALTISACEWDQATQQGTLFAPAPPYQSGPPAQSFDRVLTLGPGNGTGCATESAGADGPLTFGWATDQNGNCTLPVTGPTYPGQIATPPAGPSEACESVLDNSQDYDAPILVPVYVSVTNAAGSLTYTLRGFAHFVVTGYHMPGGFTDPDWLNPANDCQDPQYCVNGYFVQGVIPATGNLTGINLGVSVIDLTG